MRRIILPFVILIFVSAVNIVVPFRGASTAFGVPASQRMVMIGAYDPAGRLKSEKGIGIDHIFFDWNLPPQNLRALVARLAARKRILMVTLEPFPRQRTDAASHASAVLAGEFDQAIAGHCAEMARSPQPVWLRWGHEMDFDTGRYAWAGLQPETYIAMFRHVTALCRKTDPTVQIVWSPGGDVSLQRYYPGGAYVDMVGLTLFGLQPYDSAVFGRSRGFAEAFEEKYSLVEGFAKPVVIAEFGICGSARYRVSWLVDALRRGHREFPRLAAIVYFNDREPYRWPEAGTPPQSVSSDCDMEYPDWRLRR